MADLTKTIDILFGGKNNIGPVISGVKRSLSDLDSYAQNVAQPLASVAGGILAIDAALGAMAVGGMALALRESEKFGDGFAEISTLVSGSAEDLDQFRADLKAYAQDSTQSIEDIQAATYSAISAGIDMENSLDALRQAEQLAVAGRARLADTTVLLAGTLNAYGEEIDQAERYSDVFFKTVERGQTTIPELASSLSKVTSLAGSAGIPIETLSAAVATLTAKNIQTSEAVSGLKAAISNIIKPTADARQTAEELGIQFDASALKSKGLEGVLLDVAEATKGDTEQMSKLFGSVEGLNAVLALVSGSGEMFVENLEAMQEAAGSTAAAYDKMAENISLINQNLANNVRITLATLGDRLTGSYSDAVGGLVDVVQAVSAGVDAGAFDPLFDAVDLFADRATDLMEDVAENLPAALAGIDWSGFIDALEDLGATFGTLFEDIDLRTPEGLEAAMQGVVDTLESLVRVTQGMVEYFKPLFDALQEGVGRFNELDEASKRTTGKILAVAQVVVSAGAAVGAALVAIKESGAAIEDVFDAVIGSIRTLWNGLQTAFDLVALAIVASIKKIVDAGVEVTRLPFMDEWHEKLQGVQSDLEHTALAIRTHLEEQARDTLNSMGQAWDGMTGKSQEAARAAEDAAKRTESALVEMGDKSRRSVSDDLAAISEEIEAQIPAEKAFDIKPRVDEEATEAAKKAIDDVNQKIEEGNELALARMEADTTRYITLMEVRSKESIAAIEAQAEAVTAAIESSGETAEGFLSTYASLLEQGKGTYEVRRALEKELELREGLVKAQQDSLEAQTRLADARASRVAAGGKQLIQIEAAGLSPHIEAFMRELLQEIQVWATEEGATFLLGT